MRSDKCNAEQAFLQIHPKTTKKPAISDWFLELMTGFEPVTSSLPNG